MIKKFFTLVCILLVLISCSKDTEPNLPIVLSSQNTITSFALAINGEIVNGAIDQIAKTISFSLVGAELSSLKPTILYSDKATISPSENENQNFNNEVTYTVTAENGDKKIYQVIVNNRPLSSENTITSFQLTVNGEIINGTIDQIAKTIYFNLVGAELSSSKPTIQYSDKATISPSENENQNFNNEVTYTVTAENGDSNIYKVIIDNRPLGTENKILSFSVSVDNETIVGNINNDTNIINFDIGGLNKSSLIPILSVSEYATISPGPTIPQNFEVPVNYTVTAENGEINEYRVMANLPTIANNTNTSAPLLYYTRANLTVSGNFLDPNLPGAELYLSDGTNEYTLPILRSVSYDQNGYTTIFNLYTLIPENIPTYNNYKIAFRTDNSITESDYLIDLLAENVPKFISLNQDSYFWNDVLVINGENLTDTITIPSNGSNFVVSNSNNYDYTLNNDKTQISLILDYYYLFPAYFGRPPSEKTITFWGPGRRIGESFTTTFN